MPTELVVPDIGDFHDIPVIEVLVKPGDRVEREAPLITLESDKATMEIPASEAGVVAEVRVKLGDVVSQGTVIVTLEAAAGGASAPSAPGASPSAEATPSVDAPVTHDAAPAPSPAAAASAATVSASPAASVASTNGHAGQAPPVRAARSAEPAAATAGPVHASPSLRRFARELGVDLGAVRGTGPNGRITHEDVQGFVKTALAERSAAPAPAANGAGSGLGLAPWPVVDFAKQGPIERVPLSRIKKVSGPNLARNWVRIPHVTQFDEADVTELEALRKQLGSEKSDVKVTMLAFVMKAAVATLKAFPEFNSSLGPDDDLILKHYYHLGFAADVPGGLVVPVVREVDRKGIVEIASDTAALAAKARAGKLMPAEMSGASFTISSLGGIGGTAFTPIINAPEVAILGLSRTQIKPRWNGTAFEPRLMLPLSLSYDHRVIDGASAARFIVALSATLGDLRRALL